MTRDLLDEVVENELKRVRDVDGEEREQTISNLTELYKLKLEEDKRDFEIAKEEGRLDEEHYKNKTEFISNFVGKLVGVGVSVAMGIACLVFEEHGSITSLTSRDWLRKPKN